MRQWFIFLILLTLTGCRHEILAQTPIPTNTIPAYQVGNIEGQPVFPMLTEYWVADPTQCFSNEAKEFAYKLFNELSIKHIAEVAVICQGGISEQNGGARAWLLGWARNIRMGKVGEDRSLVWLIRPDVDPAKSDRIVLQKSTRLYWFTEVEWNPIITSAGKQANFNHFDEALTTLAQQTYDALVKQAPLYTTSTPGG
jgi:hypothetical protein